MDQNKYCNSLTEYSRRESVKVNIGQVPLGADCPIRVQSMTTIDTMDTQGSVDQTIRMVDSGCEYVRITAPSIKEAQNLQEIKNELRAKGIDVPLVADIHFTPNAAELAAKIVEKVRVNPGNYADKKKFEEIDYTDESYEAELLRIKKKFTPLVEICKANGTAMRIGTNHGSLSDRIMSRFGDTPLGMVESALEFLRICDEMDYHEIVLSMKASNTRIMVQAYRLLVHKLEEEGLKPYPLHLGVTEAGDGEDGRIKSAVGIGALLEDGLGDTVRVSLTEEPEYEAPVAQSLIDRYANRSGHQMIAPLDHSPVDPFVYERRKSIEVLNFGDQNVPRVIADFSGEKVVDKKALKPIGHHYLPELDKWKMGDTGADYVYSGTNPIPYMLPNGLREVLDYEIWKALDDQENKYPLLTLEDLSVFDGVVAFVQVDAANLAAVTDLKNRAGLVVMLYTQNIHAMAELRRFIFEMMLQGVELPVVLMHKVMEQDQTEFQLATATDVGGLLIDGLGDGVMLSGQGNKKVENDTAFGILQAARTRMTKTEYISCPSCGRTLFDLQETTAMIRKRTDHLKGVKIGIMGCIVNGPGEMADADYGYVGSGKGKITLYRGQTVVKRAVPSERAVDELIEIIREDDNWVEPETEVIAL
ncbi:(E)-4-hydroxy-3-methylbut-2-enyl-diphosphate synthase [Reichenbachiella sp. MSK19-1]|uniref:(E)-4-hydroxy-3-methylbut-2-enyl-diphosphate synthase n=1 Tax=Reichenbachiella sp. MSK19-1 TaxID=1897631 RepID=UPI000E6B79BA|nr:(E)-4-hydroxy-3-methylbut-2-enyl-diphosphate synthase [Reichenbachiella sp. MSK19-1]RJE70575.1 4-hydroxy-3-methylbut-2-en-1-yl diphosphate synthase [Reichenbachiella sp. MSK19-1]